MLADRVKDTSVSTGAGNFVLSGSAPVGFQALSAIGSTGSTFGYVIDGGAEWEVGTGTITAANTFSRAPSASSNAGALVNFSAGTKTVFHSVTAAQHAKYQSTNTASFATAIPLTSPGATYMPQQTVSAVLAFTVGASPMQGALVYLRLVADGTNAPTFTGFKEWGGSLGYDNRAGIVNQVQFFYDGVDYWYSISQAIGATAVDGTAPTASSAAVANATPTVVDITFSEPMDQGFVPPNGTVVAATHTTTALAWLSATVLRATVTAAFVNAESRSLVITPNGTNNLRDLAGNQITTTQTIATITNNVAAPASAITVSVAASNGAQGVPVTVTVGTNNPLTGSQTEAVTLSANVAGTWSVNPVNLSAGTATGTSVFTPSATGVATITGTAAGTPTLANGTTSYTVTALDTQSPTLSLPTGTQTGATTADGSVSTDEANGTLYAIATLNATETAAFVKTNGATQTITSTGVKNVAATALTTGSVYYWHFVHRDAAGNDSGVAHSAGFTPTAASAAIRALAGFTMLTEGGSDPNWTYTGAGGAAFDATGAVFNKGLAASALGSLACVRAAAVGPGIQPALCAIVGTAPLALASRVSTLFNNSSGGYLVYLAGTAQTAANTVTAAVGDVLRIRRSATTTLIYEVSQDSGATFIPIFTQTGAPSGALNFQLQIVGPGTSGLINGLAGVGLS